MIPKFKKIALIGKYKSTDLSSQLNGLMTFLLGKGVDVIIESSTATLLDLSQHPVAVMDYADFGKVVDLAIITGGDGTILIAARQLAAFNIPLVGINFGRVGFLSDISVNDSECQLDEILYGKYKREERGMLQVQVFRHGSLIHQCQALNEHVLEKGNIGHMIEFKMNINQEFVCTQRSDGIIIATPTGSTAYALAANGPILHPLISGIAIVPVCPQELNSRPITLPDNSEIQIQLLTKGAILHSDGQELFHLKQDDEILIRRSLENVTLLHPSNYSYFSMLRQKLHWHAIPRP